MSLKVLRLNLKRKWWEKIRDGSKTVELRRATEYWQTRLIGRSYDEIHLCLGYPRRGDESRTLKRKWRCVAKEMVQSDEFGPEPVEAYVIDVAEAITPTQS